MKYPINKVYIVLLILLTFSIYGCYTLVIHPKVKVENSSSDYYSIRLNDNCFNCHNENYLLNYNINLPGTYYVGSDYRNNQYLDIDYHSRVNYFDNYYSTPWWFNNNLSDSYKNRIINNEKINSNTETNLKNNDGLRKQENIRNDNSLPLPTRNQPNNQNSNSNSSQSPENSNKSEQRDNNSGSQLRDNQGERGK